VEKVGAYKLAGGAECELSVTARAEASCSALAGVPWQMRNPRSAWAS